MLIHGVTITLVPWLLDSSELIYGRRSRPLPGQERAGRPFDPTLTEAPASRSRASSGRTRPPPGSTAAAEPTGASERVDGCRSPRHPPIRASRAQPAAPRVAWKGDLRFTSHHRLDPETLRGDFPILGAHIGDAPLVYLDSAATSQKPQAVIDAEVSFLTSANAAVHRGAHTLAAEATELFEDARATVAGFVGAEPEQLVWTSGATAGINLVAYAIGNATGGRGGEAARRFALAPGDEIVVTESEHHANLIPWQELAARTGAVLRHIPVHEDGTLDLEAAASLIGERTRIVAFPHVSNVLGIVNPVEHLVALARSVGALTVLDACQSAPHLPLDLPALGVDLAVFSGHKMLGPVRGRRALRPLRGARGPAAVPHRRLDDHDRDARRGVLPPAAAALRGRHAAGVAGDRAGRRRPLPRGRGHGCRARARAAARAPAARRAARGARAPAAG